jgi:hypothetical protein
MNHLISKKALCMVVLNNYEPCILITYVSIAHAQRTP